jgi:hypothetical protein
MTKNKSFKPPNREPGAVPDARRWRGEGGMTKVEGRRLC